ncbi:guanylate kinase [Desulfonispora thiosulfatigenes DSM 11270]|uniref:Guanylate kinase n=1 Tax=Desulfonispora thiosulfatigenes DSM 11270 TaxID=656914 RepID=A0A1W1VJE1_DESTI|nr:guanylate kinase [Desulfonispora thiosulfatigenes]SMB93350.1 guanylate kinase [Desulfonispora thiosulfatigenes DSM 11270]
MDVNEEGLLIILSGPSGAGKGTICKRLLKEIDVKLSISATTRKPRNGEVHGKEYFFITKEEFEAKLEENEFLEWAKVYDNYYGTPNEYVEEILNDGHNCILEIDPQGAKKVKEKRPDAIYLFIIPPSMQELEERLKGRGTETNIEIEKRLGNVCNEMEYLGIYDYVIVNDIVEKAVEKVKAIILAEKCKAKRNNYYIF